METQQTGSGMQKYTSGNTNDVPIIPIDQISKGLLASLERSWYDNYNVREYRLMPHKAGAVRAEARFLQIYEVPKSIDDEKSNLLSSSMQNVISSLRDGSHGLVYALSSIEGQVNLFTGVRHFDREVETDDYVNILYHALRSNYPGIVLKGKGKADEEKIPYRKISFDEYSQKLLRPVETWKYLSCVTGIPSLRDTERYAFSQSIDRLVDALQGETYLLMIVAEPIQDVLVNELIAKLRELGNNVHKMVRVNVSEGRSQQTTKTETESGGLSIGLPGFINFMANKAIGFSNSEGVSKQVSAEKIDKTAQFCEQLIDHYIQRLQLGRGLGFWNAGVYIASPSHSTAMRAQSMARSLYSGEKTHYEPIRVLDISESLEARNAIKNLRVPALVDLGQAGTHPLGELYQSLGTPITTEELSILTSFPSREVPGLKIKPVVDFNLNPPRHDGAELGTLLYRGTELKSRVSISQKSLTRHTFVTGLTGSGKTNSCLALLVDAYKNNGLNFLVIDPAKTEYRLLLQDPAYADTTQLGKDILLFTLGTETKAPFRLNPFEFDYGFELLTHIDLLKSVFNSAFPMYASMPYLLEEAIFAVYQDRGWNLKDSTNRFLSPAELTDKNSRALYWPRLSDLYTKIDVVVREKGYDERLRQDITAALKTRIGSLLNGGKGAMLDCYTSIPMDFLLNRPVVLELGNIGDDDEKAFIMALLFIRLYETNKKHAPDGKLRHVTLIEEAHRLLRNVPVVALAESANPRGKAIEMFTDMMAEMRAHGEGFIIVDQMPGKLVPDVVKGSNLKIVHRLLAQDDRDSVGNAMGLKKEQIDFLPYLKVGQAVMHSEELEEACFVKIDPVEDQLTGGEGGEKRFDSLSRLVMERFNNFKNVSENRQVYQRFPACVNCTDPCNFHVTLNRWKENDQVVQTGRLFVSALLFGVSKAVQSHLDQVWQQVSDGLQERYLSEIPAGDLHCACVHLALQVSAGLAKSHPQILRNKLVKLQIFLTKIFESSGSMGDIVPLLRETRQFLLSPDMLGGARPAIKKPGCKACRKPCQFGHIFQIDGNQAVLALAKNIDRQKKEGKKPVYQAGGRLTSSVSEYLRFELNPENLDDATYCWLVNSTDDSQVYASYWEAKQ